MRIYTANNPQPVNSVQRKPIEHYIPPFKFKGFTRFSESVKWYPRRSFEITGGYATTSFAGSSDLGLAIFKSNIFEQGINATTCASAFIPAGDNKSLIDLENPLGGTSFSPYDWLTIVILNSSGHRDLVVQLYANEIN